MSPLLRRTGSVVAAVIITGGVLVGLTTPAQAAGQHSTIRYETHHDRSIPLAQMTPVPVSGKPSWGQPIGLTPDTSGVAQRDPVGARPAPTATTAPGLGYGFDGLGQGFTGPGGTFTVSYVPPDTNAAVGATQIVEQVNVGFAVFSKSGTVLYGPAATNTLFSGFGNACETRNDGDGIVRYDALASRWVISQFALPSTGPSLECVAVSQTSDATGAWYRYSFDYQGLPDYPKLAVWPDAYYMTYNLFNAGNVVGEACALNRATMLTGAAATQQCFASVSFTSMLGADYEGGLAPPAGEANTVLALGTTATTLVSWKFHVDWATPSNSRFTGPTLITVASHENACHGILICVPQLGTIKLLDTVGDRLMFPLSYRNFGDHEAVVVNHTVTYSFLTPGLRWYELRNLSGTPTVFQQGLYSPDSSTWRWMGSMAMDRAGNIGLGYSASNPQIHPQIRITGRLAGDPLGTMTQGETTVVAGQGSQLSLSRWGDYSSMVVDPMDGCTFWYAQEYIPFNGTFNWRTHLQSFNLPHCLPPVQP